MCVTERGKSQTTETIIQSTVEQIIAKGEMIATFADKVETPNIYRCDNQYASQRREVFNLASSVRLDLHSHHALDRSKASPMKNYPISSLLLQYTPL
jgi:hypothetical protein